MRALMRGASYEIGKRYFIDRPSETGANSCSERENWAGRFVDAKKAVHKYLHLQPFLLL